MEAILGVVQRSSPRQVLLNGTNTPCECHKVSLIRKQSTIV